MEKQLFGVLLLIAIPGTAFAQSQCNCRTIAISGDLPQSAVGIYETDAPQREIDARHRPSLRVPLDSLGYSGQGLFVRFSKAALSTWQAEVFEGDPTTSFELQPSRTFHPLVFSAEGAPENRFCGEVRPPEERSDIFGDRIFICFDRLHQSAGAASLQSSLVSTEQCACFEYAKDVAVRPAQFYTAEEYERMLRNVSKGADSQQ